MVTSLFTAVGSCWEQPQENFCSQKEKKKVGWSSPRSRTPEGSGVEGVCVSGCQRVSPAREEG